ncbi:hypothetical protein ILUMI_22027 [Ignelater luminosus]|uniref:Reverse transcriptase domain-containing protein n=1 Tax=Ignelater luminosus TaxID=2038154 RepID=A0A8K0CBC7_IGNLU|nr:hypothetical protein ILUMI_22027 [Ignelater luminosus]
MTKENLTRKVFEAKPEGRNRKRKYLGAESEKGCGTKGTLNSNFSYFIVIKPVASEDITEKVLRTLWINKMLENIKNILLISDKNLDKLFEMADKIAEINPHLEICPIVAQNNTRDENISLEIAELRKLIASLQVRERSYDRNCNATRSCSSRSRSRKRYNANGKLCYYKTYKLYAANNTEVLTLGSRILSLDLGLHKQFQWPFIVTKVERGILGADFLNEFNLLVNIKQGRLLDGATKLSARVYSRPKQLDSAKLEIAKQEFQFMLDNGIVCPPESSWASALHMENKENKTARPCGDYSRWNDLTVPDRYSIPRIENLYHILKGKTNFSKIDLFKAYYQIPIVEEDKEKTAIITCFGLYEHNVVSCRLRNASSTFQRFVNEVFYERNFLFPYLDDILVASASLAEHRYHLQQVLDRLNNYGFHINISKSVLGIHELEFLGYQITKNGSKPLPDKVEAILNYKLPETVQNTKKRDKKKINWTKESKSCFEQCKQDLATAAMLTFPDPRSPLDLCTNASELAIGAVLQQYEGDGWEPITVLKRN